MNLQPRNGSAPISLGSLGNRAYPRLAVPDGPLKKILLWNDFYGKLDYGFGTGRGPFQAAGCRVDACVVIIDRNLFPLEELDALVWHTSSHTSHLIPILTHPPHTSLSSLNHLIPPTLTLPLLSPSPVPPHTSLTTPHTPPLSPYPISSPSPTHPHLTHPHTPPPHPTLPLLTLSTTSYLPTLLILLGVLTLPPHTRHPHPTPPFSIPHLIPLQPLLILPHILSSHHLIPLQPLLILPGVLTPGMCSWRGNLLDTITHTFWMSFEVTD
ncbi:hypothetical protein C7M84_023751 [Penaeus vannamei]|uniref:Uncharacterized protein n=1 Tax=Penaeus vannamei TaxID=6689 RepID=A0A3R7SZI7_PENVA|nr:hypothetical protein C7M84_023751 [Penaeus vannamei]